MYICGKIQQKDCYDLRFFGFFLIEKRKKAMNITGKIKQKVFIYLYFFLNKIERRKKHALNAWVLTGIILDS